MQFFGRKFELEGLEDIYEKPERPTTCSLQIHISS